MDNLGVYVLCKNEENFIQAFPNVDINNLPDTFIEFVRVAPPNNLSPYEIYEGVHYEIIDGVCTDVHTVRTMTVEEKQAKQDQVKSAWAEHGYPSWVFNETTCVWEAPIEKPDNDKIYDWNEENTQWDLVES